MKRFFIFLMATCFCLACIACTDGVAATESEQPEWLAEDALASTVQGFEVAYQTDGAIGMVTYYAVPEGGAMTLYSYAPEQELQQSAAAERPQKETALTVEKLPELAEALKAWAIENHPDKEEYRFAYLLPEYSFLTDAEYPANALSVSLASGAVQELAGEYEGSKEYGSISIAFDNSIQYTVYIDD